MTLDNIRSEDYSTSVAPYLVNGVIIDTCVIYEIIDGLISTRISGKKLDQHSDFEQINAVFDLLHLTQNWTRLYVTPHILTEACRHLENTYNKRQDYKKVVSEIFPMLEGMGEHVVSKSDFCRQVDMNKPIIESGDISIFVTVDDYISNNRNIAILTKDGRIRGKYKDIPHVMVIDYRSIALNLI